MEPVEIDARVVSQLCFSGAWAVESPILVLDRDTVRFANQVLLRMLGYGDAHELIGHAAADVVRGLAGAASSLSPGEGSQAQPPHNVSAKLLRKRGGSRQETAYVAAIEVGSELLTLLFFYSAQGIESESRLPEKPDLGPGAPELGRAIIDALPVPILIQDFDTILFANAAARTYLQTPEGDRVEGQPIAAIVHPDGMDAMVERVQFVFDTQHTLRGVPVKVRTFDGRPFHTVADAYPIQSDGVLAALILATSVSEGRPD